MSSSLLILIIYLAFISLGLPDSVLGVAWPTMRSGLGARLEAVGLISLILTSCSAISSVFSGAINKKLGTGLVVLLSSILTATGLLGYALAPSYLWVLVAALPLGFGQGAVDSSLNGYVATHYSSRHMNWLHASWGVGATIGPIVMTGFLAAGRGWRTGYLSIAILQGTLALLFLLSLGMWHRRPVSVNAADAADTGAETGKALISGMKHLEPWLQISMYAIYTACEFSVGIWTVSMLVESRGIGIDVAGFWVALYYGGITVGRILTGLVADRWGNRFMVRLGLLLALAGALLLALRGNTWLTLPGLLMLGLGFAPIYPCLMHETPRRFDRDTYHTVIGFQIGAACLGASVLPGLVGLLAGATTLEVLAPCVAGFIILLFAMSERLNKTS